MSSTSAHALLRRGELVTVDGTSYVMAGDGAVHPGDTYIAERNTGPKLLEARAVDERGWIVPRGHAYPYDTHECVRVRKAA